MSDAKFTFQVTPCNAEALLPQISRALEKRTELLSRRQYPNLWKQTDRFNAMPRNQNRSPLRTRILSILCLGLGIFLLVPGLMEPQELFVPLAAGALAVAAGVGGLWRSFAPRRDRFSAPARKLLQTVGDAAGTVSFDDAGMELPWPDGTVRQIPYREFECAVECPDVFLLVYGDHVSVLQKTDLAQGTATAFRAFLEENGVCCAEITGA